VYAHFIRIGVQFVIVHALNESKLVNHDTHLLIPKQARIRFPSAPPHDYVPVRARSQQ